MKKNRVPPKAVIKAVEALSHGLAHASRKLLPAPVVVLDMVAGRWRSAALGTVVRLGIAELLRDGPWSVADLASAARVSEDGLYRVLRALAREGVFEELAGSRFALNAPSRTLLPDDPSSMHGMVSDLTNERNSRLWAKLDDAVRTGEDVMHVLYGKTIWEHIDDHPDEAQAFHRAMTDSSRLVAPLVAASWDFGRVGSLCDVGGGAGELLATIVASYPGLRGVCFDLPRALEDAPATFARHGVSDRCTTEAGDHCERVPEGHGAYLLKNIVHGLGGDPLARTLAAVRRAMGPHSKLLLVEHVVPPSGPYMSFLDLQILLSNPSGKERSREQYASLLEEHGLRLEGVVESGAPVSLLMAERAG